MVTSLHYILFKMQSTTFYDVADTEIMFFYNLYWIWKEYVFN